MGNALKAGTLAHKVVAFLVKILPRSAAAKEVAVEIGQPLLNVRVTLRRLAKRKVIEKNGRGLFQAHLTLEALLRAERPEMTLHGITISGKVQHEDVSTWVQGCPGCIKATFLPDAKPPRWMVKADYEGRSLTVQIFRSGEIQIMLSSSKYPLKPVDFIGFEGFLKGMFGLDYYTLGLRLDQIGIGYDLNWWRLEGIRGMRLGAFGSAYAEFYQKSPDVLRLALHINPKISLESAVVIMRGLFRDNLPLSTEAIRREEPPREGYG